MLTPHAIGAVPSGGALAHVVRTTTRLFAPRTLGLAHLEAQRDLEPVSAGPPDGWRVSGPDPRFVVIHPFAVGWIRIRLKGTAARPGRLEFHADEGDAQGSQECLRRLEVQGSVNLDCFLHLDRPARGLRMHISPGAGEVRLESLCLEPLSGMKALAHAVFAKAALLRKYWQTRRALGRGLALLARGDFAALKRKLFHSLNGPDLEGREPYDARQAYDDWRASRCLHDDDRNRLRAEAAAWADPPLFTVVLSLGDATAANVQRSLLSVFKQIYSQWDLCITVDVSTNTEVRTLVEQAGRDQRIRLMESGAPASSDYITLLDAGDELAEQALFQFARAVVADRGLDLLYADEDRLDGEGNHVEPYFKPDWSPETLLLWMYIGRPTVFRTATAQRLGGLPADAAREHDLALRLAAESPRVRRVADVLYHRRELETASADRMPAEVQNVRFAVRDRPIVSIIIASACLPVRVREEKTYFLHQCLESLQKSTWGRREIIVLHGPIVPPALVTRLDQWGVVRAAYAAPFNWARAMNQGAALAQGEHLLFLNDDVELITPDWLESLLEYSQQSAVGAVGATLLFPNGRIQHAGVAVLGGRPMHPFYSHRGDHPGYFNNLRTPRNCSAVTGACLMTRADVFRSLGGFDEGFPLNYNDVDYCLRVIAGGRRVVCTPYARLYHHEMGTRPAEVRPAEREAFLRRWGAAWAEDPYYNPNLSTEHFDYRIRSVNPHTAGNKGTAS